LERFPGRLRQLLLRRWRAHRPRHRRPSLTGSRSAPQKNNGIREAEMRLPRLFPTWYWRALGL
jgi:hypothetical protein